MTADGKLWIIYAITTGTILFLMLCSGCATWQGFQQDIGITKPESKPGVAPSPGVQLWKAAKNSNWLVTVSILGIAAGVFTMTNGATKLGLSSIAAASVSLFMALAVARFALWMAVFGLLVPLAAALFSILARRKALVEIITGVQEYRDENGNSEVIDKTMDVNQSPITKRIVQTIKNGLKLKGVI